MLFGLAMFPADYAAPPHEVALRLAGGFGSLLFPEHTHDPVKPRRSTTDAADTGD